MPNGDLYRWLDNQDLFPVDPSQPNLRIGDFAVVQLCDYSHFNHPQLTNGVIVKIVKIIQTDYYEVKVTGAGNFGWFTGFELSTVF
jgi:ribosomal 30S subunit maturation factor RimM